MHLLQDGICVTCRPVARSHELVDGQCVTCRTTASRHFNPDQLRDPHSGKWTDGAFGPAAGAAKDLLKLAGRIDLAPGEELEHSDKLHLGDGDADAVFAWTSGPKGRHLRLGFVANEDVGRWRGANKGATAVLDADTVEAFHQDLTRMSAEAKRGAAEAKAHDKRYDAFEAKYGTPSGEAWKASLPPAGREALQDLDDEFEELYGGTYAKGGVYADWGDIRYELDLTDGTGEPIFKIGISPKGETDLPETYATMSAAQLKQFITKLGQS